MSTLLREKRTVARKEHRCMFCGGVIHKGDTYNRQTIADNGEVYDWVSHTKCDSIFTLLDMYKENGYEGVSDYEFDAFVWSAIEELHPDRIEAEGMTTEQRVDWLLDHKYLL